MTNTNPAVSVIIPVYNTERYVGECLDSILRQTFQNFEVIVVDDCSTDNSVAVIESYTEKFGGRLKLLRMDKNSGSPGVSRNKAMSLASGEYIFFMDSDDILLAYALKGLYTLAKKYDADIVHYTDHYVATDDGKVTKLRCNRSYNPTEKILVDENLFEGVKGIIEDKFSCTPWKYFTRRDLIVKNELSFPNVPATEDYIFMHGLLFNAKKILFVPRPLIVYRKSESSVTRQELTTSKRIRFDLSVALVGVKWLDKMMGKIEFFRANPKYRYYLLKHLMVKRLQLFLRHGQEYTDFEIYEVIRRELGDILGEQDVSTALLLSAFYQQNNLNSMNIQQFEKFTAQAQQRIAELEAQLQNK